MRAKTDESARPIPQEAEMLARQCSRCEGQGWTERRGEGTPYMECPRCLGKGEVRVLDSELEEAGQERIALEAS